MTEFFYPPQGGLNGALPVLSAHPPADPSALLTYALDYLGEPRLFTRAPDGSISPLLGDPFSGREGVIQLEGGGGWGASGTVIAEFGVGSTPAIPTTPASLLAATARREWRDTGGGLGAGFAESAGTFWRGNVAGRGGFWLDLRVYWPEFSANQFSAVGLVATPSAADPALSANAVYLGFQSNTGGLVPTSVDQLAVVSVPAVVAGRSTQNLGAGSRTTTSLYQAAFYARPNSAQIYMLVVDLSTGAVLYDQAVPGASLPANTVTLALVCACNAAATGAPITVGCAAARFRTPT